MARPILAGNGGGGNMADRLDFRIVFATSQFHRNPATNLELVSLAGSTTSTQDDVRAIWRERGWISEQYGKAYQEIVLRLEVGISRVRRLRLISHEICVSKKIEISAGVGRSREDCSFRVCGHVFFSSNQKTQHRAREEKIVSLDATANFIRLRLFESHETPANTFGQVGLVRIEIDVHAGQAGKDAESAVREFPAETRRACIVAIGKDR